MKLKLTNAEASALHSAFNVIAEGASTPRPDEKRKPFVFRGKIMHSLSRNLRTLKGLTEDLEKTRLELVAKHLEEQKKDADEKLKAEENLVREGKYGQAFLEEFQEVLEQPASEGDGIELFQLQLSGLDLDRNSEFPIAALAELEPLLVDDLDEHEARLKKEAEAAASKKN